MANILIIEDSPTDAHAYSRMLQGDGHSVEHALDGEQGIAMASANKPDLILMDIVMPGVNGFQATRELQNMEMTNDIPIIMLSTKDQEIDRIWGLRQGASDYLVKPVKKNVLLQSVDSVLASA